MTAIKITGGNYDEMMRVLQTEVQDDANDRMAEMGRLLGKPVVAECVENQRVAGMLRELGIEWAQGFAFHQPEQLTAGLLRQWVGVGTGAQQPA